MEVVAIILKFLGVSCSYSVVVVLTVLQKKENSRRRKDDANLLKKNKDRKVSTSFL